MNKYSEFEPIDYLQLERLLRSDDEEMFEIRSRVAHTLREHIDYDVMCLNESKSCIEDGIAADEDFKDAAFYPKEIDFIEALLTLIENN